MWWTGPGTHTSSTTISIYGFGVSRGCCLFFFFKASTCLVILLKKQTNKQTYFENLVWKKINLKYLTNNFISIYIDNCYIY